MANCHACKIILIGTNIGVALLCLLFFALGVVLFNAGDLMNKQNLPFQLLIAGRDVQDASIDIQVLFDPQFDLPGKLKTLSMLMIIVSLIILLYALWGCGMGFCCSDSKVSLRVYSVMVSTIIAPVCLIGSLSLYVQLVEDQLPRLNSRLGTLIKENYVSEQHEDLISVMFTAIQESEDCCGSRNGGDYAGSLVLEKTYGSDQVIPVSCCKAWKTWSTQTLHQCTVTNTTSKQISNYNFGCFDVIQKGIKTYFYYSFAAVSGTVTLLYVAAIAGCCLFSRAKKEKKSKQGMNQRQRMEQGVNQGQRMGQGVNQGQRMGQGVNQRQRPRQGGYQRQRGRRGDQWQLAGMIAREAGEQVMDNYADHFEDQYTFQDTFQDNFQDHSFQDFSFQNFPVLY